MKRTDVGKAGKLTSYHPTGQELGRVAWDSVAFDVSNSHVESRRQKLSTPPGSGRAFAYRDGRRRGVVPLGDLILACEEFLDEVLKPDQLADQGIEDQVVLAKFPSNIFDGREDQVVLAKFRSDIFDGREDLASRRVEGVGALVFGLAELQQLASKNRG